MENVNLNPNSNTQAFAGLGASRSESNKSDIASNKVNPARKSEEANINLRNPEGAKYDAVKQASQQVARANFYPVSDVRFTIYKDKVDTGEYAFFTRFTSLRDGAVTVVGEQQIFSAAGKGSGTLLEALV